MFMYNLKQFDVVIIIIVDQYNQLSSLALVQQTIVGLSDLNLDNIKLVKR